MRPMTPAQAIRRRQITARYPPSTARRSTSATRPRSASRDLAAPDYGDAVEVRAGEVPVFWACGVTPQAVAEAGRPELMITHAPGHMFVTDLADARPRPGLDQGDGAHGRSGRAAQLERQADEGELAHAVGRERLEIQRLDDVDPRADDEEDVAGQRAELGVARAGHVPGQVVGADGERVPGGEPARGVAAEAAGGLVGGAVAPQGARAEAHEHDIALAQLDVDGRGLELAGAHRVARGSRSTPSAPATSSSTPRAISGATVSIPNTVKPVEVCTGVDRHAAVQVQVLGLVAQGVDVRARVLGHHEQGGGARARLARPASWRRCSEQQRRPARAPATRGAPA